MQCDQENFLNLSSFINDQGIAPTMTPILIKTLKASAYTLDSISEQDSKKKRKVKELRCE
jgi:hypothetical protein